jgi:hypothetical protein
LTRSPVQRSVPGIDSDRSQRMIGARIAMLLAAAACSGGCATYRYGTHQPVAVVTDPPGASCRFERHGKVIARIEKTPGEANIERSIFVTRLTCSHADHFDESVELVTERAADLAARDPARLPGVVTDTVASAAYQLGSNYVSASAAAGAASPVLGLGLFVLGPIMLGIDLATSAWVGFRQPPVLLLPRGKFDSEVERDDHFAVKRREYETQAARMRDELAEECWRGRCPHELRQFDRALEARLERLEMLRLAAVVQTPQP